MLWFDVYTKGYRNTDSMSRNTLSFRRMMVPSASTTSITRMVSGVSEKGCRLSRRYSSWREKKKSQTSTPGVCTM